MDYFSRFLRAGGVPTAKVNIDHAAEFHKSWTLVKNTLLHPDERQLTRGIKSTDVPARLQSMVDSLVWESSRTDEGDTGACLEYLLKNDVLGILVKLSEPDRPFGIQAEVLQAVQNMVVLLDEQFLVHSVVHKAVLRLLRNCVGDDIQEQLDGRKVMGAAGNAAKSSPSEYEEDLVNLLCILCSRIRTHRELLMIFFHDKHWYHSEPLFAVEEEDEEGEQEAGQEQKQAAGTIATELSDSRRSPSPALSQATIKSAPESSVVKRPEYEFLLFNYLVRFVHREGQIGDFARAGLLFLMDVAMSPGEPVHRLDSHHSGASSSGSMSQNSAVSDPVTDAALALAEYVLDGDFSEVLGAGLGAVYSLLPSKLEIRNPQAPVDGVHSNSMVIGGAGPETEEDEEKAEFAKERSRALGLEDSSNPDFKGRLDHFLKLLEFLQDVLRRNAHDSSTETLEASTLVGSAIVQSILDAVRRIFLENVLYPSILECSDVDGSAVAVMAYIEVTIRTLPEGSQVADLLVSFLMSEDNDDVVSGARVRQQRPHPMLTLGGSAPPPSKSAIATENKSRDDKLRRRKSSAMMLLEMEAPESRRPSEYFTSMARFTLKDLLLTNLKSDFQSTATAALQLLDALLVHQCQLSADKLLLVVRDPDATSYPEPSMIPPSVVATLTSPDDDDDENFVYPGAKDDSIELRFDIPLVFTSLFRQPDTTYTTHEREMGLYLALVSRVDPSHNEDAFSTGYDHYLRDALVAIQGHTCFRLEVDPAIRQRAKHRLDPNDPILSLALESLRNFFSNTPDYNIALTGVLATLAICPNRSLAGWLTFASNDPHVINGESEDALDYNKDDGDDRSVDFKIDQKLSSESSLLPASSMDEQSRPVLHSIFHGLVSQLERYRQLVKEFDKYLLERRQGLLFSENLNDALNLALDLPNEVPSIARVSLPANTPDAPPRPTPMQKASSFVTAVLTPKKNRNVAKSTPGNSEPSTPSRGGKNVAASPFGSHYQQTGAISVEPFVAPMPSSGPWTPAKPTKWNAEEEDVFSSGGQWGENSRRELEIDDPLDDDRNKKPANVTLSQLLDNVVILEESIKELAAIIHARRSLGIDSVRYL